MSEPTDERPAISLRTPYMQALNAIPTALYRLYGADDRLLYAGVTIDPKRRFREHSTRRWWPKVVRKKIEWYETRTLAQEAEAVVIRDEKPIYDATHRLGGGWMRHPNPELQVDPE